MIALRPFPLRASLNLSLTLAIALGWLAPAQAQQTKPVVPPPAKEKAKKTEKAEPKATAPAEPIDLNSATTEELTTLPGIGEATARKIVDARPHKALEDLSTLGVPARTIDGIKTLAVVRPLPVAVDLNTDPLNRVETLPGVGPTLAKEIVAGRPYAGMDDLAKLKGFGPAKVDSLKGRVKFGKVAEAAKTKPEPKAETTKTKAEPKAEPTKTKAEPKAAAKAKEANVTGTKVNLNTASKEALDALPGIGPVYAQAIVDARPFSKIEDVMKIKGIKEVEFGKIKDMITVTK